MPWITSVMLTVNCQYRIAGIQHLLGTIHVQNVALLLSKRSGQLFSGVLPDAGKITTEVTGSKVTLRGTVFLY